MVEILDTKMNLLMSFVSEWSYSFYTQCYRDQFFFVPLLTGIAKLPRYLSPLWVWKIVGLIPSQVMSKS